MRTKIDIRMGGDNSLIIKMCVDLDCAGINIYWIICYPRLVYQSYTLERTKGNDSSTASGKRALNLNDSSRRD